MRNRPRRIIFEQAHVLYDGGGNICRKLPVIARRFALAGAQVSLNYNAAATAATEVMNAITTGGGHAMLIAGDISNEASVRETIKAVIERFGRIDTLINNAGIHRDRLLLRMTSADFDDALTGQVLTIDGGLIA